MKLTMLSILAAAITLIGCATGPPVGNPALLDFLADNRTTKAEVMLKLGQPSGRFESEQILTYRLGYKERNHGYYVVERAFGVAAQPYWANTKYSLVLVFDGQNILQKHSLVEVTR
jgi:hypothetical protein